MIPKIYKEVIDLGDGREISIETLELFIGVHSNNTLVGKCEKFYGDLDKYFEKLK